MIAPLSAKVAIIGARRTRQGTGPFIARAFLDSGCVISAVLGTSMDSALQATQPIGMLTGMRPNAYTDLDTLIAVESPDIVALCCPPEHRFPLLKKCADSGIHCYSEKPLWWKTIADDARTDEAATQAADLVRRYQRASAKLGINTQWPTTLSAFETLHGKIKDIGKIQQFSMLLGPSNTGLPMLIDSLSHPLSMLYELVGVGSIDHIQFSPRYSTSELTNAEFSFLYRTPAHSVTVNLHLTHSPLQPRPAAYEINGLRIVRHIDPESYLISFAANDRSVTVTDPLLLSVRRFLGTLESDRPVDYSPVIAGMKHLYQLVSAAQPLNSQA